MRRRHVFGRSSEQETTMAKSQKRSNREPKKPKAAKAPMETAAPAAFAGKPTPSRPLESAKKR